MLRVIRLDFDYQDKPLLDKVSFHLPEGGLLHLRGRNGAGKTTLLKLIAGLLHPLVGEIQYLDQNINKDFSGYQHQLCFVGHQSGVNPNLTLKENCFFDLHYSDLTIHSIDELAALFKLEDHLNVPCGLLSAGQRRQAGLLRLWMTKAKLWLLDEPLVALDNYAINIIMAKITSHREQGGAVLLTSHQQVPLHHLEYEEYCL